MTQKSCGNLLFINTASVVGNADEGNAALLYFHGYGRGTGINGVFHQLLNDRSRSLHHFTGGNLINCLLIQHSNLRHFFLHSPLPAVFQLVL